MIDLNTIKQTGRRLEQGAWVMDPPELTGLALKVRGFGNSDYNALFAQIASEYEAERLRDPITQRAIETKLLVETILVDWQIADLPYSRETALQLLNDPSPELLIFRRAVNWAANNVARLGRDALEVDAKNSQPSSDGDSSGASAQPTTNG